MDKQTVLHTQLPLKQQIWTAQVHLQLDFFQ